MCGIRRQYSGTLTDQALADVNGVKTVAGQAIEKLIMVNPVFWKDVMSKEAKRDF